MHCLRTKTPVAVSGINGGGSTVMIIYRGPDYNGDDLYGLNDIIVILGL